MRQDTANQASWTAVLLVVWSSLAFVACGDDSKDSGTNPEIRTEHVILPLKVGNIWNFDRQITGGLASIDAYSLQITATREIEGETYFTLVDIDDESPSETYIRQSGNKLWLIPQEFFDGKVEEGDALTEWIQEEAASSFPWKYGDTDAVVNVPWTIFEASGQISLQGFEVDVSITVVGHHLGAGETTVPAGTFTTARTRIDQHVALDSPVGIVNLDSFQELEVADEVGFIRIREVSNDAVGDGSQTEESTLTSYTLVP